MTSKNEGSSLGFAISNVGIREKHTGRPNISKYAADELWQDNDHDDNTSSSSLKQPWQRIAHEAEAPKLQHTLNARCGAVSQDRDYAKDSLSRPIRSSPEGLEEK